MNKLISKIVGVCLGLSLATGVGVGVVVGQNAIISSVEATYEETAFSGLETGDVGVIVGNNGSNYAMSNNNGTSAAPGAVAVSVTGDEITSNVANTLLWEVTNSNGNLSFTAYDSSNKLYCTNSNNGVRVGTNSNNVFTIDSGYLYNTATERYVGIYNGSDWRCYTSNGGNIANQSFKFFKQNSSDPAQSSATITPDNCGWTESEASQTGTSINGISASVTNGLVGTASNIKAMRVYKNQTLTVASQNDVIVKIIITCIASGTSKYGPGCFGAQTGYSYSGTKGTWTGSAKSVSFVASADQVRITEIVVTYSSSAVSLSVSPSSLVIAPDQQETLTATTGGGSGSVSWATSDSSIVSISSNTGNSITVTGVALGNAVITASYSTAEDVDIPITVYQLSGAGTQANPYTCSDVYFLASQLDAGTNGGEIVYASGTVLEVTNFNSNYNSATFTMTDGTRTVVAYGINNSSQNLIDNNYVGTNCRVVVSGAIINHATSGYEIGYASSSLTSNLVSSNKGALLSIAATLSSQAHAVGDLLTAEDFVVTVSYSYDVQGTITSGYTWTVNGTSGETTSLTASNNTIVVSFGGMSSEPLFIDLSLITGSYYEKVTSDAQITDGRYLIVYEEGGVAFNGGLETFDAVANTISVSISDNKIEFDNDTEAAEFIFDVSANSIQGKSGKYIGIGSYNNGLLSSDTAIEHNDFSVDSEGNANISRTFNNGTATLKYNSASDQTRFRYYKTGQKDIQLYKYVESTEDLASNYADLFLETLSTGDAAVCQVTQSGEVQTVLSDLVDAWEMLADEFDDLGDYQDLFTEGQADEDGTNIQKAIALYDYIATKYNTQLETTTLTDYNFMGRTITPASNVMKLVNVSDSAAIPAIVVVIALATVTTGAYFFLRKKKEN